MADETKPPATPEVKPSDSSNAAPPKAEEKPKADPPPPVPHDGSRKLLEEALDREKKLKDQLAKEQEERMHLLEEKSRLKRVFKPWGRPAKVPKSS